MHHLLQIARGAFAAALAISVAQAAQPDVTSPETLAFRRAQSERLAAANDRDSRIAAALLALPCDSHVSGLPLADVHAAQKLLQPLADDELALYVAALACHLSADCRDAGAVERLTARAPHDALHWLLRPGTGSLSDATLHSAAAADSAGPHLGELHAVLNRTLSDPANEGAPRDARDDALAALPNPRLSPLLDACKGAEATRRSDCIAIGRRLFADARGSILSRMIGSVVLRRLAKGTADNAAAKTFRRDYVWLGEHAIGQDPHDAALQADTERHGEWEAWLRAADRAGVARTPPADWVPKDPQQLLLPEERRAAGG